MFDSRWITHIYKFFQTFTTLYFISSHKNIIFYCFSFLSSLLLQEVIIIYQHHFLLPPIRFKQHKNISYFFPKIYCQQNVKLTNLSFFHLLQPLFTIYPSCNFCSLIVKLKINYFNRILMVNFLTFRKSILMIFQEAFKFSILL